MVHSLAYDETADAAFGVVQIRTGSAWATRFACINLRTLRMTTLGPQGALDTYSQFNAGVAAPGLHLVSAFRPDHTLWLVGINVTTGEVVLERQRVSAPGVSPNFVDMAFWPA